MEAIIGALLIFFLRIGDVSLGTLRVLAMVQGRKWAAALLGFGEASVYILALVTVLNDLHDPARLLGYACGYACGTALGMTLEGWIASGWILTRIISRDGAPDLLGKLRQRGFGVTAVRGHGKDGEVLILFIASPRKRAAQLLTIAKDADPTAFITTDPIQRAINGYLPHAIAPAAVRK
jgi:uncharacterized protein YebE (UPF0316 family)